MHFFKKQSIVLWKLFSAPALRTDIRLGSIVFSIDLVFLQDTNPPNTSAI